MNRNFERLVEKYREQGGLSTGEVLAEFGLEVHEPLPPDQEYHLSKMANTVKELAANYKGAIRPLGVASLSEPPAPPAKRILQENAPFSKKG
jgi:hypothetical protein